MVIIIRIILPIVFIIIGFISVLKNNFQLRSFSLSSLLPSLLLSMLDLYLEDLIPAGINIAVVIINSYIFLRLNEPNFKFMLIGSFIYLLIFISSMISQNLNYLLEYRNLLGIDFLFYLIINPLFLFPMLKLKNLPKRKIPIRRESIYSKDLKKHIGQNKFSNNADIIYFLVIGSSWGIFKWWYQGDFVQGFLPISGWLFALSIVLIMFKNSKFSSMLVSATFPLMYLLLTDEIYIDEIWWIRNLFYHLIIILLGLYVLLKKRDADFEYVFVYGIWLRIMGITWHLIIPGYLKSIHTFFYISFIDVIITPILVFYICNRKKSIVNSEIDTKTEIS